MRMPSAATTCLLIGAFGGVLLWLLGDPQTAIRVFIAEGVAWAGLYAFALSKQNGS